MSGVPIRVGPWGRWSVISATAVTAVGTVSTAHRRWWAAEPKPGLLRSKRSSWLGSCWGTPVAHATSGRDPLQPSPWTGCEAGSGVSEVSYGRSTPWTPQRCQCNAARGVLVLLFENKLLAAQTAAACNNAGRQGCLTCDSTSTLPTRLPGPNTTLRLSRQG
jgi:hypothetical protein